MIPWCEASHNKNGSKNPTGWIINWLFTKLQKFGLVQIQSISRWRIKSDSKIGVCLGKSRKHCGKRRKCLLPAFSPFPTMFSKAFFSRGVKSWDCAVKSETNLLICKKYSKDANIWPNSVCADCIVHLGFISFSDIRINSLLDNPRY